MVLDSDSCLQDLHRETRTIFVEPHGTIYSEPGVRNHTEPGKILPESRR